MKFNIFLCIGLIFAKESHFTSSPYCVVIQAQEQIKKKIHFENSTICITVDLSKIEMLPKPARQQSYKNKDKVSTLAPKKSVVITPTPIKILDIVYPSEVSLFQNATLLARVAEPVTKIRDPKIK